MPTIYMKEFSGIAISAGLQKITKIKAEKNKLPYRPSQDYYKQLRDAVIASSAQKLGMGHLLEVAEKISNPKKKTNYQLLANKYSRWLGKKNPEWFSPPRGSYKFSESEIMLNPELGLSYSNGLHAIKLHFSEESISQDRANYMLHLMKDNLTPKYEYHVFDIRREKLFSVTGAAESYRLSIVSEISGIEAIWKSL